MRHPKVKKFLEDSLHNTMCMSLEVEFAVEPHTEDVKVVGIITNPLFKNFIYYPKHCITTLYYNTLLVAPKTAYISGV